MKQYFRFVKCFLLLATPAIASSVLAMSPSQAATLALADANLEVINFSQSPSDTSVETITNTVTVAKNGIVGAMAVAEPTFIVAPPTASNSSLSQAFGQGTDYLGLAESEAKFLGFFDVNANTSFSFNFNANLNLQTSIDNPPGENARAAGNISLALLNTANNDMLDFFSLTGNVATPGDSNFIAFQNSDHVTLTNPPVTKSDFGGNQESATASVHGSLQRSFANETTLALVELKRTQARVVAPEPSTTLALLICGGVVGVALLKQRRKETTSPCSLETKVAAEA
ncbi:MAG: PEP-CTERM sorting domain-containing protein [Stigonema ocellatum SAG 48.90 = DSM 106950]|nr:PEP-CTERM sorting domain-containing protein [Stigonema ocellatum SAG 48.90 = DSM 106950]